VSQTEDAVATNIEDLLPTKLNSRNGLLAVGQELRAIQRREMGRGEPTEWRPAKRSQFVLLFTGLGGLSNRELPGRAGRGTKWGNGLAVGQIRVGYQLWRRGRTQAYTSFR